MVVESQLARVTILSPVGKSRLEIESDELAERATSLSGKVIGFLDDGVSKVLFDRAKELFQQNVQPVDMPTWMKPNPSVPAPQDVLDEIVTKCDVAIVGTCF